jgi:hypothetical protein
MLISTKIVARIDVARVRKSAAPRALISPDELPLEVSPPPSERCIRMTATSAAAMMAWTTRRNVYIDGLSFVLRSRDRGRS